MMAATRNASITSIVANPRFMCRDSRLTAGAMAMDANQLMRTVKMTEPPSSMTKRRNKASAISAMTTRPTRQMFPEPASPAGASAPRPRAGQARRPHQRWSGLQHRTQEPRLRDVPTVGDRRPGRTRTKTPRVAAHVCRWLPRLRFIRVDPSPALLPDWLNAETLLQSLGPYAFWGAVLIIFAECGLLIGFFLPGDSLIFVVGLLIAQGTIDMNIWVASLIMVIAAVTGNLVGTGSAPRPDLPVRPAGLPGSSARSTSPRRTSSSSSTDPEPSSWPGSFPSSVPLSPPSPGWPRWTTASTSSTAPSAA